MYVSFPNTSPQLRLWGRSSMPSKDGWTLEREHERVTLGRKSYRNMEEWSRPCAVCGEKFSIFTNMNSAGTNSSFGLKTCKEHRGQKVGGGVIMGEEYAQILQERDEAWATNTELLTQNAELRRRLAQYELPEALRQAAAEPATGGGLHSRMPWE